MKRVGLTVCLSPRALVHTLPVGVQDHVTMLPWLLVLSTVGLGAWGEFSFIGLRVTERAILKSLRNSLNADSRVERKGSFAFGAQSLESVDLLANPCPAPSIDFTRVIQLFKP